MEFDLRQWLLFLGPVFIAGILLHGYWRVRRNRGNLRMALDKNFLSGADENADVDDLAWLKAELPNGGARIIKPEQTSLSLSQDVPVLMEQVDIAEAEAEERPGDQPAGTQIAWSEIERSEIGQPHSGLEVAQSEPDQAQQMPTDEPIRDKPEVAESDRATTTTRTAAMSKAPPARKMIPEMFVVVTVMADDGHFNGQELLEALLNFGMTYGEMNIFHRLNEDGFSEFSLANALEPGTFDISTMGGLQTPGVTLFMRVHELADPLHVYDELVRVATGLAEELGGMVRDESRSVMTAQTIEHCRQEIRDFQFRHSA